MQNPIDDFVIVCDMARIGGTGWMDKDKSLNHKDNLRDLLEHFCDAAWQRRLAHDFGAHGAARTG
jgi:hypothetical protein